MKKKRTPSQSRSRETKDRIMEAGLKLFGQKGLHATSSREIVSEAGVAIGSFYSYFEDKRDLFIELLKLHRSNVLQVLSQYSSEISRINPDLIRKILKTMWEMHPATDEFEQKANMMRSMDAEVDAILREQEEAVLNSIISFLKMMEDRLRIKNIDAAGSIIILLTKSAFHSASKPDRNEMDTLIDELSDMISRYLFK